MRDLPKGCHVVNGDDKIVAIDPAAAYPARLEELELELDQYGLEVARRSLTTELLDRFGRGIRVRIERRPEMALKKHPIGRGAKRGAAEFRRYHDALKRG